MLLFAAATQSYFLTRNRIWETVALLLIALTLFRPGLWLDLVDPPYENRPGSEVVEIAGNLPAGAELRMTIEGPDFDNPDEIDKLTIEAPLGEAGDGAERLKNSGLLVMTEDGKAVLEEPFPGTPFFKAFQDFDFYGDTPVTISNIELPKERIAKEVFYIPAIVLLVVVVLFQRRRQTVPAF
jgi:hypothetical protein